jgi:hypothetical protein
VIYTVGDFRNCQILVDFLCKIRREIFRHALDFAACGHTDQSIAGHHCQDVGQCEDTRSQDGKKITARDVYAMVRNGKEPENLDFSSVAATLEKPSTYVC